MRIVTIHAWAARGFTRGAADYEKARPDYPSAAVELLGLSPGNTVVDVGAGTGKLTRQLVETGTYPDHAKASDIHVTPNGAFLYGAERKTSLLHGFRIDPPSGTA